MIMAKPGQWLVHIQDVGGRPIAGARLRVIYPNSIEYRSNGPVFFQNAEDPETRSNGDGDLMLVNMDPAFYAGSTRRLLWVFNVGNGSQPTCELYAPGYRKQVVSANVIVDGAANVVLELE